jgi:hypothetical protein
VCCAWGFSLIAVGEGTPCPVRWWLSANPPIDRSHRITKCFHGDRTCAGNAVRAAPIHRQAQRHTRVARHHNARLSIDRPPMPLQHLIPQVQGTGSSILGHRPNRLMHMSMASGGMSLGHGSRAQYAFGLRLDAVITRMGEVSQPTRPSPW